MSNRRNFSRKYAKSPRRACIVCGRSFVPYNRQQRVCGDPLCVNAHKAAMWRAHFNSAKGERVEAKCARCGVPFSYVSKGKPRKFCDRCGTSHRPAPADPAKSAVSRRICLFCGHEFNARGDAQFCHKCVEDGFDSVYRLRKEARGADYASHGEKCRRAGKPDNGYRKGLRNADAQKVRGGHVREALWTANARRKGGVEAWAREN